MKKNLSKKLFSSKGNALSLLKGFTLIELLIVIAVLGILAAGVLILINPVQQLARGRDAARKSTIGQLARATQAFYTSRQAVYPVVNATWVTTLVNAGEVQVVPAAPVAPLCTTNVQNGWCYLGAPVAAPTAAAAWVRLESASEINKCAVGTNPFFMWDSARGSTCLVCVAGEPALAAACNAIQ